MRPCFTYIEKEHPTWTIFWSKNVIFAVFQFIHRISRFDCTCGWIICSVVNKGVAWRYLLTVIFLTFKCTLSTYKCFAKGPFLKSWTFLNYWSIVEPSTAVIPKQAFVFYETTCIKLIINQIIDIVSSKTTYFLNNNSRPSIFIILPIWHFGVSLSTEQLLPIGHE